MIKFLLKMFHRVTVYSEDNQTNSPMEHGSTTDLFFDYWRRFAEVAKICVNSLVVLNAIQMVIVYLQNTK